MDAFIRAGFTEAQAEDALSTCYAYLLGELLLGFGGRPALAPRLTTGHWIACVELRRPSSSSEPSNISSVVWLILLAGHERHIGIRRTGTVAADDD